ncbi:MAG: hypothetical protein L6V86_01880 [Treponema sp.]|nr:MAG: hypothetical protein L6V86_01880 [Treponema sp.]
MCDPFPNNQWADEKGFKYVDTPTIFKESDVLSLHCPLTEETYHIVNHDNLKSMKNDAVIINTGRGALIDTKALVHSLSINILAAPRWTFTRRKARSSSKTAQAKS